MTTTVDIEKDSVPQPQAENPFASDVQLVRRCLDGNEVAWAELIDKYKNLIFSIPIKYGFQRDEAADIFQSVCAELVNELPKIREPKALAGWLIRVAHNKCFHLRKESKRFVLQDDDEEKNEPAASADEIPANILEQTEREQRIRCALRALAPRCRQLIDRLFFRLPVEPYQAIASELGVKVGSIGFIRMRCLDKLRAQLGDLATI